MRKFICLLVLAGCTTVAPFVVHDVPNLRVVDAKQAVFRGGQPLTSDGWDYIHNLGVSNVIKLNLMTEGSDAYARIHGMNVWSFGIDWEEQTFARPDDTRVKNAVKAIGPGTYIHCEHGQDRTGLIVGCYRVWVQKWTKAAARKEMLADGFHKELHGLNDYWEDHVK